MKERIRAVRSVLHLSQRAFGQGLGVSRDVISNLEQGRAQPRELFLCHLCELYGVNENWLKTGEGEMFDHAPIYTKKLAEAIKLFCSLRPEYQDYALEQLRTLAGLQERQEREQPKNSLDEQ